MPTLNWIIAGAKEKSARFFKEYWPYLLAVLVIVSPWFFSSGYLFFTDFVRGPEINLDWTRAGFLVSLLWKGLAFIFPSSLIQKIYIAAVLLLVILGGRALVRAVIKTYEREALSSGLLFSLSLFALFNPFVYDRALYGQFGVIAAYGFLLFTASYLLDIYRRSDFSRLWQPAIFSGLAILFSLHFIFFLGIFYLLFLGALLFGGKRRELLKFSFWRSALLGGLIVLIINSIWLGALISGASPLGDFVSEGISPKDLAAFETSGKNTLETYTNVIFMSGFWGKDQYRYVDLTGTAGWQKSFVFLLPLILFGLYLSFRGRSRPAKIFSISLLVVYALAIVLAVGLKSPLVGSFSAWLYEHFPFYKGLREPQKWVAVIIPIYLAFLTLGVARLKQSALVQHGPWLAGTIFSLIIILQAPLLLWGFSGQARPIAYPDDWYEVNEFLLSRSAQAEGCSERILFLPWHLYMSFNWSGRIMANPAPQFFSCPVFSGTNMEWGGIYDNSLNSDGAVIKDWLKNQGGEEPPAVSGEPVRYIVLAKELDFMSYSWLNNRSYLEPIKESLRLVVYEVK